MPQRKRFNKQVGVMISQAQYERLCELAKKKERTVSAQVREMIQDSLERLERNEVA